MSGERRRIELDFGKAERFSLDVETARVAVSPPVVPAVENVAEAVDQALASPIDFAPLESAVIPDDHVALALDPKAPGAAELVAGAWRALARRGVGAENVVVVQPKGPVGAAPPDPREMLPAKTKSRVGWKIHDPDKPAACAYVASTASGDRVYLARPIVEAEVSLAIGSIAYDPLLGCRGAGSALYPGLSTRDAIRRAHGQGHDELDPDDDRPLRQLIDEVAWLVGMQFSLQSIPASRGGVAAVLAGASEAVLARGRKLLAEQWQVNSTTRPDVVVAAVDVDAGDGGWDELGAALAAARRLVARGGRIVALTNLSAAPGEGVELIRSHETPRDALQPLRKLQSDDLVAATQIAAAADWARVVLVSALESDIVEDLSFTAARDADEAARLLRDETGTLAFLPSAQHRFVRVTG